MIIRSYFAAAMAQTNLTSTMQEKYTIIAQTLCRKILKFLNFIRLVDKVLFWCKQDAQIWNKLYAEKSVDQWFYHTSPNQILVRIKCPTKAYILFINSYMTSRFAKFRGSYILVQIRRTIKAETVSLSL